MLKFEGKFKVGDVIKAYDFEPLPDREDRYAVGTILHDSDTHLASGARGYLIRCTEDTLFDGEYTRVGDTVFVPFEVSLLEFDTRITKVK